MIFPDRIRSIESTDKVLEIGPGGRPHPRSDVFLELRFASEKEALGQRGHQEELQTEKEVVYYEGREFPFDDDQFDYVICSHVLEHVEDVTLFLDEIARVGKKGYLEYPRIYYDYLYNFKEHLNFLMQRDDCIYWFKKADSPLGDFKDIQNLFYQSLWRDYKTLNADFVNVFFEGFEWSGSIKHARAESMHEVCYSEEEIRVILPESFVKEDRVGVKKAFTNLLSEIRQKFFN